jgi:hypothetical protein
MGDPGIKAFSSARDQPPGQPNWTRFSLRTCLQPKPPALSLCAGYGPGAALMKVARSIGGGIGVRASCFVGEADT